MTKDIKVLGLLSFIFILVPTVGWQQRCIAIERRQLLGGEGKENGA